MDHARAAPLGSLTLGDNSAVDDVLSTTEGAVLGLVAFGRRSGYDLARLAANSIEHLWTPSQSQIYKTLPRLAARGLVSAREVEQRGRPDKSLYGLTANGRRALRRWLDEVEEEPASGRVVFPLKLFLCEFASPGTAAAQLKAYRRFLTRRLDRYESLREAPQQFASAYPRHVLEHGITRAQATLGWIERTLAAVEASVPARSGSSRT
jgi:PadR family transcriptional regulator, regulatory protein AphA